MLKVFSFLKSDLFYFLIFPFDACFKHATAGWLQTKTEPAAESYLESFVCSGLMWEDADSSRIRKKLPLLQKCQLKNFSYTRKFRSNSSRNALHDRNGSLEKCRKGTQWNLVSRKKFPIIVDVVEKKLNFRQFDSKLKVVI